MQDLTQHRTHYVAATTAHLLISYLDRQALTCTELRHRLAHWAASSRIPITAWWALLEEIRTLTPGPVVGLEIGCCAEPHHVGVLGYLAMYSDTAAHALMRFSRFQPLLHNLSPSLTLIEDDELIMTWGTTPKSTLLSDEVVISGLLAFAGQLLGNRLMAPLCVEFPHPAPADIRPYEDFLGCPVIFTAKALSVRLPLAAMNQPVDSQEPHLMRLLEQQAEALMQALPMEDTLLSELQRHIVAIMQDQSPELTLVAARMGLSERTLYRQLSDRGLRYKNVLNAVRYELAKDYLKDAHLSLPEISLLLGFAEQSVFSRAFKGWSGLSPMRYRKALA